MHMDYPARTHRKQEAGVAREEPVLRHKDKRQNYLSLMTYPLETLNYRPCVHINYTALNQMNLKTTQK